MMGNSRGLERGLRLRWGWFSESGKRMRVAWNELFLPADVSRDGVWV